MIKIRRANRPASLDKPDHLFVKNDYKNNDVKGALLRMQYSKCCYCERDIGKLPKTEREVDHYVPRSAFKDSNGNIQWHSANQWGNLLYSCRTCNSKKGNKNPFKDGNEREKIDPSVDDIDPEDHIDFVIEGIIISFKEKNGSLLGRTTIDNLKFDERIDLFGIFRRQAAELEVHFIDLINAITAEETAAITSLVNELSRVMSAHVPIAAFKRSFIRNRVRELNEEQIPRLERRYHRSYDRIEVHFPKGYETVM